MLHNGMVMALNGVTAPYNSGRGTEAKTIAATIYGVASNVAASAA